MERPTVVSRMDLALRRARLLEGHFGGHGGERVELCAVAVNPIEIAFRELDRREPAGSNPHTKLRDR